MEKFERFLREYGWIMKAVLAFFWVFWATQLSLPIRQLVQDEIAYQQQRDAKVEAEARREGWGCIEKKIEAAKAEGPKYGTADYFEDLRQIREKKYDQAPFGASNILLLQRVAIKNIEKGYFSWNDFEQARERFEKFEKENNLAPWKYKKSPEIKWKSFFSWLLVFYCRSVFLVLLFYLVRMSEQRCILAIVLAEKWKFVYATLGWMFYFHKYPSNVLREIRVEAELRRIGKLFRRFSSQERSEIRRIANGVDYHFWLTQFHQTHVRRLRRSLLFAVLVTIMFRCIPLVSDVQAFMTHSGNDPPIYSSEISNLIAGELHNNDSGNWCVTSTAVFQNPPPIIQRATERFKITPRQEVVRKIEHIPLSRLFDLNYCRTATFIG
ncbi:hypothetical protein EPN15_00645 [Patescibacteria group bacterium]|nr:MAG: hypothetical protein EPN15_00645 [Patescibacteria group bacterium]